MADVEWSDEGPWEPGTTVVEDDLGTVVTGEVSLGVRLYCKIHAFASSGIPGVLPYGSGHAYVSTRLSLPMDGSTTLSCVASASGDGQLDWQETEGELYHDYVAPAGGKRTRVTTTIVSEDGLTKTIEEKILQQVAALAAPIPAPTVVPARETTYVEPGGAGSYWNHTWCIANGRVYGEKGWDITDVAGPTLGTDFDTLKEIDWPTGRTDEIGSRIRVLRCSLDANLRAYTARSAILYLVRSRRGAIRCEVCPMPTFPPVVDARVTPDATTDAGMATEPSLAEDSGGRLILLFRRPAGVFETTSTDAGTTWSEPVATFPDAKHPICAAGLDGSVVRAVYKAGRIRAAYQAPGAIIAGPAFECTLAGGAALTVADDTFDLTHSHAGLWILHARPASGANSMTWWSADNCRTWTPAEE